MGPGLLVVNRPSSDGQKGAQGRGTTKPSSSQTLYFKENQANSKVVALGRSPINLSCCETGANPARKSRLSSMPPVGPTSSRQTA